MYFYAHDKAFAVSVIVHRGSSTDADHARYVESFSQVNHRERDRAFVFVLVVDAGSEMPNPKWRERIAEASRDIDPATLVVFVSESTLTRGIVTAINWLRPPPYSFSIVANIDDAIAWIDGRRPGIRPVVQRLYVEARRAADASATKPLSLR